MGIRLSGHVIGLLKEYMRDLVEQARQEDQAHRSFGFTPTPYRPDLPGSLAGIIEEHRETGQGDQRNSPHPLGLPALSAFPDNGEGAPQRWESDCQVT